MLKRNILFTLFGAALVGIVWAGVHSLTPSEPHVLRGNFDVSYTTESAGGTRQSSSGFTDVSAIRLCPGYVVIETRSGSGQVFFGQNTLGLSWKPKAPAPAKLPDTVEK